MRKIQVSAKNVQKAIDQGLKELGAKQEDVDIKILDEGGLFRKAKVELIYADGVESEETEEKSDKEDKKEIKRAEKELIKAEKKALKEEKKAGKEIKAQMQNEEKGNQTLEEFCTEFLKTLCKKMNIECEIAFERNENGVTFNATGEKVGPLIGKRGETLNAIQEILSNVAKKAGFREERVYFDVENYKNRRELSLVGLAERMAKKAIKIEKPIKLERMNAYERKIIHTALQNFEGVVTKSEGEEPNRYLVIIPQQTGLKQDEEKVEEPAKTDEEMAKEVEKENVVIEPAQSEETQEQVEEEQKVEEKEQPEEIEKEQVEEKQEDEKREPDDESDKKE
jgi:spoIIIJ-associated protein